MSEKSNRALTDEQIKELDQQTLLNFATVAVINEVVEELRRSNCIDSIRLNRRLQEMADRLRNKYLSEAAASIPEFVIQGAPGEDFYNENE